MFHFGFSYIGLIWLLMLFVPNLIWTKNKPQGYEESAKKENKILLIFEKIGQALTTVLVLIFSDLNIDLNRRSALPILGVSFLLMVCYELYWVRYFRSEKTMKDFYSSFLGIPVAGATLPVLAFFVLGLYGANAFILIAVILLGIGHIGIHLQHRNETVATKTSKKAKLPVRILKGIGAVLGCLIVLVFTVYFSIRNVTFIKAFAGAKNPVFEDRYVEINGQEQYIRVMGRDINNPVIILLHGGPGSPDGSMDYCFMDYLLDEYTYITWDQRGSGRTYYRNKSIDPTGTTVTVDQLLEDVDALTDYARNRFGKEKVTILGHSWGTILATRYSLLHPEKLDRTFCIGTAVNFIKAEEEAYNHAKEKALADGQDVSAMDAAFKAFQTNPGLETLMASRALTNPYNKPDAPEKSFLRGALSPYLGIDDMRWLFIDSASLKQVYEHNSSLIDFLFKPGTAKDLREFGTDFKIPMYYIHGWQDYTCATSYAKNYFDDINASVKSIYLVGECGHTPQADKPEEVAKVISDLTHKY